jgi:putative ABC transport system permease protein
MNTFWQDVRYGLRTLLKRPGFAAVAILTLALGIGANTAIFSVVNAVLLRPLPYPGAERLVAVYENTADNPRDFISYPNLWDYRDQSKSFEEFATFVPQSVNLTGTDEPDRVRGGFVNSAFFRILRAQPAAGRTFLPQEDYPAQQRVAVVNYAVWQKRFGGDPKLIGRTLQLNGESYTVVGIMPESFRFEMDEVEVWLPAQFWPNFQVDRAVTNAYVLGRLREGVTLAAAQAEMQGIAARLVQAYPKENQGRGVRLFPMHELLVEDIKPSLLVLLGAVGFILLITCANIANLLLARGAARQKELAVRAALGAGRLRLFRQLLTETMLLSVTGGALGLLLALWGVDGLLALNPAQLPTGQSVHLDAHVLWFTLALAGLTGILFGLVPAVQLSTPDLYHVLKEAGRATGAGGGRQRLRGLFVVSQVALSLVLLVGTGLLLNSFYRAVRVNPGFAPENLLTMEYRLPRNKYQKPDQQWAFHREVIERIRAVPGVQAAAVVRALPFSGNGSMQAFTLPDRPAPAPGHELKANFNTAGVGYFETIGIPLLKGRTFNEQDKPDGPPVVVINQLMARKLWPDADPVGKQVYFIDQKLTATIVGVVGDAKQYELTEPAQAQIYNCYAQNPGIFGTLVVRTQGEPLSLAAAVKQAVWSVDREQPVWKIRTVAYLMSINVASQRFVLYLMLSFALLALLLTTLGIYGVISYTVNLRTHEIGIRMALGASARDVLSLVLRQGFVLALIGIGVGLCGAFAVTRFLAKMLFGVGALDPLTFVAVALVLLFVTLLACYIPARRATKVDPMIALRYE